VFGSEGCDHAAYGGAVGFVDYSERGERFLFSCGGAGAGLLSVLRLPFQGLGGKVSGSDKDRHYGDGEGHAKGVAGADVWSDWLFAVEA
jgi:hypothetical protein